MLSCPPTESLSRDASKVATALIADIHARMPTLCGMAIRYSNKALSPYSHLQEATTSIAYPNVRPVSNTQPHVLSRTPTNACFNSATTPLLTGNNSSIQQTTPAPHTAQLMTKHVASDHVQKESRTQRVPQLHINTSQFSNQFKDTQSANAFFPPSQSSQPRPVQDITNTSTANSVTTQIHSRIVPVFKPLTKSASVQSSQKSKPTIPGPKPLHYSQQTSHTAKHLSLQRCPINENQKTPGKSRPIYTQAKQTCTQFKAIPRQNSTGTKSNKRQGTTSFVFNTGSQQEVPDIFTLPDTDPLSSTDRTFTTDGPSTTSIQQVKTGPGIQKKVHVHVHVEV